jgi:hypothetical protein
MKRSMFGTLSLAAALLAACSGDPTSEQRTGSNVIVTPGFLQMDLGATQTVTVQVLDDQGNALPATFNATANNGAVVAVAESIGFRPGLGKNRLSSLFNVSALSIDSSSVTFTALGKSYTVPVMVSPLSVPVQLTPANPNVNDLVTITAPGFKFLPITTVRFGGSDQLITARAADSSSITFRATNPGTNVALDVRQIAVAYLPSIGLNLLSTDPVTVGPAITALAGTDAINTAPDVVIPADGTTVPFTLTDVGPFHNSADCTDNTGFPCRIYKFTLATARSFDISTSWDNDADLGFYFVDASNSDVGGTCDAHGQGPTGHFEGPCTVDLPAGTYFMQVVTFAPAYPPPFDVDPSTFTVTFTDHP